MAKMKRPNTVKRRMNQPTRITPTATRKIDGKHAADDHVAEIDEGLWQTGDGRVVAHHARRAAGDVEHAEGDDEGRQLPLLDTPKPLIAPQSAPTPMQPRSASGTENQAGKILSVMISAPTTVQSARTEPTERSMPPVRITNVMPEAKTVLMAICTKILRKFSARGEIWRGQTKEQHDEDEGDGDAGFAHEEPQNGVPELAGAPAARDSVARSRPYSS